MSAPNRRAVSRFTAACSTCVVTTRAVIGGVAGFFCPAHLYVGLPYGSQQCGHCNAQPVVDLADTNQRQRVADASGVPAHLLAPAGTVPPLPPLPEGGRLRPSAAA